MYSILEEFNSQQLQELSDHYPAAKRYLLMLESHSAEDPKIKRHHEWLRVLAHSHFDSEEQKPLLEQWSLFFDGLISNFLKDKKSDFFCVYALGKLGSFELNLSSDIDLIFVGKPTPLNNQLARDFIHYFDEIDEKAFFTRVDTEIRPGGNHSPLVQSTEQVENYYYYHGESWERLALIRLRPLFADSETRGTLADLRKKFCFRKYLDYGSIDDFAQLRTKIHREAGLKRRDEKLNLKLYPGGIRDVELFCHTLCVLHGGRSPALDLLRTSDQIQMLQNLGFLDQKNAEFLEAHYWKLRRLENLVQGREDSQTHSIDANDQLINIVYSDVEELPRDMESCSKIIDSQIGPDQNITGSLPSSWDDQLELLKNLGLDFSPNSIESWKKVLLQSVKSRFSERDERIRREVLFGFLQGIKDKSKNKELALEALADFLMAVRAKASLFRFFKAQPDVIGELCVLFGMSPYLSGIMCRRPELIDNFVFRAQATPPEDLESLLEFLADHKQIGHILYSLDFARDNSLEKLCENLSEIADFICRALLSRICDDPKLNILKMGKWGGRELGLKSDLDFIFVYSGSAVPADLHKKIKKFVSLIEARYRAGALYGIDLRLRPTGNAGPLLVTEQKLEDFLSQRISGWEKQAYLKAQFLNPSKFDIKAWTSRFELDNDEREELEKIRNKLLIPFRPKAREIDIKYCEGGILHIELLAQQKVIEHQLVNESSSNRLFLQALAKKSASWSEIQSSYSRLRFIEQSLLLNRGFSSTKITKDSYCFTYLTEAKPEDFESFKVLINKNILLLKELEQV